MIPSEALQGEEVLRLPEADEGMELVAAIARAAHPSTDEVRFGPFRLVPRERRLEREGVAVHLGGRALDILVALARRRGEVVSKTELCRIVWPGMIVEEGSRRFHIVSLRKALGDSAQEGGYLTTVAGRGYCFTGAACAAPKEDPVSPPR